MKMKMYLNEKEFHELKFVIDKMSKYQNDRIRCYVIRKKIWHGSTIIIPYKKKHTKKNPFLADSYENVYNLS